VPSNRRLEVGDSSINIVLDSLLPHLQGTEAIKLPTFWGNSLLSTSDSAETSSSKHLSGVKGKDFAWSRGLGVEVSPIKTRSFGRKQHKPYHLLMSQVLPPPTVGLLEH
jgi:hypothetical protein